MDEQVSEGASTAGGTHSLSEGDTSSSAGVNIWADVEGHLWFKRNIHSCDAHRD
jgi:hypothetical protein